VLVPKDFKTSRKHDNISAKILRTSIVKQAQAKGFQRLLIQAQKHNRMVENTMNDRIVMKARSFDKISKISTIELHMAQITKCKWGAKRERRRDLLYLSKVPNPSSIYHFYS